MSFGSYNGPTVAQGVSMSENKLKPTKIVKRPIECLRVFPAAGGYIVRTEFKYVDRGPNEKYEADPQPVVFGEGEEAKMLNHIKTELAKAQK